MLRSYCVLVGAIALSSASIASGPSRGGQSGGATKEAVPPPTSTVSPVGAPPPKMYKASDVGAEIREIDATLKATGDTGQLNKPCTNGELNRSSQVCAYWASADATIRAANVAESEDRWAARSFWVGLVGIIGLIATLWFNLQAWLSAEKNDRNTQRALKSGEISAMASAKLADIADKSSWRQLQAYIGSMSVEYHLSFINSGASIVLSFTAKNFGQTPATDFRMSSEVRLVPYPVLIVPELPSVVADSFYSLSPSMTSANAVRLNIDAQELTNLRSGLACIFLTTHITFKDCFNRGHSQTFRLYSVENPANPRFNAAHINGPMTHHSEDHTISSAA